MELNKLQTLKALMYERQYKNYSPDLLMYESLLDKNLPVIEFGSGTGRISYHLLQKGYTVFGIEMDKAYKNYFIRKLRKKPVSGEFHYIEDVREAKIPCNIIYPFNVIFYLSKKSLLNELNKLRTLSFNSVILETDNIHMISSQNLSTKEYKFREYIFKETGVLEKSKVVIQNEVIKNQKAILKFYYPLYLHKAGILIKLYRKYFENIKLYGDFKGDKYNYESEKLIVIVNP